MQSHQYTKYNEYMHICASPFFGGARDFFWAVPLPANSALKTWYADRANNRKRMEGFTMGRKFCILALLLSLVTAVSAEGVLGFDSSTAGILFAADGRTPMDHLFASSLAISPGEILEETICIRPRQTLRLTLQCLDVSPALSGLRLEVWGKGSLYDGPITGMAYLGSFSPEEPTVLNLRLTVPEELSAQGRRDWLKLRWSFTSPDTPIPETGDHIGIPAAVFTGALTGLALALPQGRKCRKRGSST